jgi:hypothetical protein
MVLSKYHQDLISKNVAYVKSYIYSRRYSAETPDVKNELYSQALLEITERITTYDPERGGITNFMTNILDIYLKNYYTRVILANRYGLILPNSNRTPDEKPTHMTKATATSLDNLRDEYDDEYELNFSNISNELQHIIKIKLPKIKQLFIKKIFYEDLNPNEAELEINTELNNVKNYYHLHPLEHIHEKTPLIKREFYKYVITSNKDPEKVYNKLKIRSGFYYKDRIMCEIRHHLNNKGIKNFN